MKICIDISQIVYGTGVSVYMQNLVENLLLFDKNNEYLLFGGSVRRIGELKTFVKSLEGNFLTKFMPISPTFANFLWNWFHIVKIEHLVGKIDLFHSSDWTQPPSSALKVTTVHDLAPIKFPRFTPKKIVLTHQARLLWVKKEVDVVIVPSRSTKFDLVEMGFDENKIQVIPEAVDEIFVYQKKPEIEKIRQKYRIRGDYFLTVGTNPRKNLENVIKAFELFRPGKYLSLVVVGEKRSDLPEVKGVKYLGFVQRQDLPGLYSGAKLFVYPSLYEGFGLPILEAFSCKCPVLTSNTSSMPEIAGDAAVLVDPKNLDSIVDGIKRAMESKKQLVQKGLQRLKNYSWKNSAESTIKVYNNLGG